MIKDPRIGIKTHFWWFKVQQSRRTRFDIRWELFCIIKLYTLCHLIQNGHYTVWRLTRIVYTILSHYVRLNCLTLSYCNRYPNQKGKKYLQEYIKNYDNKYLIWIKKGNSTIWQILHVFPAMLTILCTHIICQISWSKRRQNPSNKVRWHIAFANNS